MAENEVTFEEAQERFAAQGLHLLTPGEAAERERAKKEAELTRKLDALMRAPVKDYKAISAASAELRAVVKS